jgi:DNA-binding FadR family transcriptional regulator
MNIDEKLTASEKLQIRLEELILSRRSFLPGDRLPSEREIMNMRKVGRGTVREAYRSLAQKGLIEIRHGGGAFVREVESSMVGETLATLIHHRRVSTQHLMEFREAVESRCAAYAAERATPEQINELKRRIDQMEILLDSTGDGNIRFYEQELNLHTQLAKISGNPMFEWFASTFEHNAAAFSGMLANQPEKPDEALKDWRDFIQAVENKEVTRAAMIIGAHIFQFRKVLEDLDTVKGG